MTHLQLSIAIENAMVARNPRGMQTLQAALEPGYYLRAAELLEQATGNVLIGTGFPVNDTYETDGPLGAIAPLADALKTDYRVHKITVGQPSSAASEAREALAHYSPSLIISIERPGMAKDGHYYNMRGEDISLRCAAFDYFLTLATCPSVAIGDGGNEIGMGNIAQTVAQLDITPSATCCDELVIADVSNWAAHGIIAMLSARRGEDLLAGWDNLAQLHYLSQRGSVDGVSRENTLTEDGLDSSISEALILQLRKISGFC
jgi:hypothetical protein